ncbi:hypothetical protein RND71_040613 [Anisodus tanguticus]|uniref:Uncharacterized protein n=1 Tax=Anisodus tanguticus TaxID=243964 RepID=A0AAE1QTR4_9SOLA|nr:hypothetical protein RND71_040613 [Anisodus tanguticus]
MSRKLLEIVAAGNCCCWYQQCWRYIAKMESGIRKPIEKLFNRSTFQYYPENQRANEKGLKRTSLSPISSIHNNRIRDEIEERDVGNVDDISQRASARHCLLEELIKEKMTINNVVITDDVGQGKCCIYGEHVEEIIWRDFRGTYRVAGGRMRDERGDVGGDKAGGGMEQGG